MPNRNAERGARWERAVKDYLALSLGSFRVVRPRQSGYADIGDVQCDPVTIQCKDVAALNVSGWLDDVASQVHNAGGRYGVVVWKRRGRDVGNGVVMMTLSTFRSMLAEGWPTK